MYILRYHIPLDKICISQDVTMGYDILGYIYSINIIF